MDSHQAKTSRIAQQLKERNSTAPLTLKKRSVSHEVPKPEDKKFSDEKLDVSDLNEIIQIDTEKHICIAEPGVTFARLVEATLRHGLAPVVVPELKTITIGGAVAGCSIESMSYKLGGFHDNCLEYEVMTAKGGVLICTPENENQLLFQMVHGTFGTLGTITRLKFRLIAAKPYVKVTYEKYQSLEEYQQAIWAHYTQQDIDFMDGIIHSPEEYVLCAGYFADHAPYTHRYDWMRIYYLSTAQRKEDYLETVDYFFRYDKGVTNVHPQSFMGRLLFGKVVNSNSALRMANVFHKVISASTIPITLDTFIPFSRMAEFMSWYQQEVKHFPLWCVPYKVVRHYEWLADEFLSQLRDELFLDIAIYGMHREDADHYYRIIEEKLMELGALKTLISTNLYSEEEFWRIWNKQNYDRGKQQTDPDNIFRGLYEKTCRASRGLEA